ncbi:Hypothetical protein I596_3518 [Dokdonella koreensis DS-123]|uniref:Uncharacterized protein n=1 Tax=Dokdonella koreensis DS-123 TaxID=1300342 RepID=A0A167H916_9GAMM|nr:Hypothetical protein I596_3518 [Dokdonella koreensis DS-123]
MPGEAGRALEEAAPFAREPAGRRRAGDGYGAATPAAPKSLALAMAAESAQARPNLNP